VRTYGRRLETGAHKTVTRTEGGVGEQPFTTKTRRRREEWKGKEVKKKKKKVAAVVPPKGEIPNGRRGGGRGNKRRSLVWGWGADPLRYVVYMVPWSAERY
jgi:hypothetical protein